MSFLSLSLCVCRYKSYRNKAVVGGARSLINVFRMVNPEMLSKKDRVCLCFFLLFHFDHNNLYCVSHRVRQ